MGTIAYEELKALARPRENVGISIYMPFNDGTQGDLKNPALLREILESAEGRLLSDGVKPDVVTKLLRPGYDLAANETYWRDKFETLAIFIFADTFQAYKLQFPYEQTLSISRYPYLKPILHDYLTDKKIYVLVLEAGGSRLFKFDKHSYIDITPKELEKSSKEYAAYFQIERESNYHMKRAGSGREKEGIISHGHDNTEQLNKRRETEYAHIIANEVKEIATLENLPLVLAGVKSGFLAPTFRSVYDGTGLIDDYIRVETAPLDIHKLQQGVSDILDNIEKTDDQLKVEAVSNLLGTGFEENDPDQVVKMAFEGRVDTLFVNVEMDIYGIMNVFNDRFEAKVTNNPDDENLTNIAIVDTWSRDGKVFFVSGTVINSRPMMASLKY
jgi:hypothetical protein